MTGVASRVQLVGALPPDRTGIANYNIQLLGDLPEGLTVDVYAERWARAAAPQHRRWSLYPTSALHRSVPARPLCVLGNNGLHLGAYDAVLRHRGVAWFHDVSLDALHHHRATLCGDVRSAAAYAARVAAENHPDHPPRIADPLSQHHWARSGSRFCHSVVDAARGVIVHSERALELLSQDSDGVRCPTLVVPHFVTDLSSLELAPESGRVVSLGFLSPSKKPELLVHALAALDDKRVSLRWAGAPVGGFVAASTHRTAARCGVPFTLTGYVARDSYLDELRRASVVVQLRDLDTWNGEASGAVAEAIGAGVPVVTNVPTTDDAMAAAVIAVSPDPGPVELAEAVAAAMAGEAGDADAAADYAASTRPRHVFTRVSEFCDELG